MTTSKAEVTATNVTKMESKGRRDVRLFIMIVCGLVRLSREESEREGCIYKKKELSKRNRFSLAFLSSDLSFPSRAS